ncbi:haloacid dehalogenase type II [Cognatiyoonia sp. IB215182]|uniref:haloacid dehalogenase type II n=1 Tax=Cognatiyoonia sp. IB215182 TaxID=3097353 RepID=UPI002A11D03D|nr:haloacid dehalogenase type II [Cognatiyoonia sp. IB215182]MDX8354539.1 haloacid dehalogenase type II [Cognatiyoonia sp. IB215182]
MDRAFIFDVFGTLVNWREGVAQVLRAAFAERNIDADPHQFADAWRARYDPAMARIRAGDRGYVPLDILHRENLDETLTIFGLSEAFDETARIALNHAWECLPPWPDVRDGMDQLRPFGFLAPCSNGSVALSVCLARFAGFQWDTIVGAETAQSYKPDLEVYRASAQALGLRPDQVVMVAAHNSDLAAAAEAGLQTAFFPRPSEHGPGQTTDLTAEGDWTYVARDLVDLAGQIRAGA